MKLMRIDNMNERHLESRMIDNLQQFLLELGTGFAFIGRQVRFTFDENQTIGIVLCRDKNNAVVESFPFFCKNAGIAAMAVMLPTWKLVKETIISEIRR